MRGGLRVGQGRKPRALLDKLPDNPGKRPLKVMDLPEGADLSGEDMPEPKAYMKEKQRNGGKLEAEEIYRETWLWLKTRHCEKLVSPQLISQYAMAVSRWIQCEHAISEYGFLAKHPTTNAAIASPYVTMSQNYMKDLVPDLPGGEGKLLRGVLRQYTPG